MLLLVVVGILVPSALTALRSTHRGRPIAAIALDEGRVMVRTTARSTGQTVRHVVIGRSHVADDQWADSGADRASLRIAGTLSAVMLLLYLVYVVVDGMIGGRFRAVAFTFAAVAFVGNCAALLRLS